MNMNMCGPHHLIPGVQGVPPYRGAWGVSPRSSSSNAQTLSQIRPKAGRSE